MNNEDSRGFGIYAVEKDREMVLSMQELWVTGTILPIGARLIVRHQFKSGEERAAEVIYAFQLPRDAAMRRFRIVGEDFESESALKPTEKAREEYEAGMEKGNLSVLAQHYRDGLVNLNVGNIRPNETVTVYLEIVAGVAPRDNGFRFCFPFTLAPAYHAQATIASMPDGIEMLLPENVFGDVMLPTWRNDSENLHRVGFNLNVHLPGETLEIASPSHPISVRMQDKNTSAQVSLGQAGDLPNRDLVLDANFTAAKPVVYSGVDDAGKGRFAVLIPSTYFGKPREATPRQVVLLVDRSGSMNEVPFKQAKQAALACIAALRPQDRFGLVFFESSSMALEGGCCEATQDHRDAARKFVEEMDTAGGTELAEGVRKAAQMLPNGGNILLLTDGQVFETATIIAKAKKLGICIHCLGIGSASRDRFLALLARATGGTCHFATPRERVDEAALRLFNGIGQPAAENVHLSWDGGKDVVLAPEPPATLWQDMPLTVFGSADACKKGKLCCTWQGGSDEIEVNFASGIYGETIKLIQGARITTDMEADIFDAEAGSAADRRNAKRRAKRWVQVAEEYGLANPEMALVAVVKRKGDRKGVLPETRIVPVGMPQDMREDMLLPAFCGFKKRIGSAVMSSGICRLIPSDATVCYSAPKPPSFLRHCQKTDMPEDGSKSHSDSLDVLFSLVGRIQADGGLPGADTADRILQTLLSVLALREYEITEGYRMFNAHIERMIAFIEAQDLSLLDKIGADAVQYVLAALSSNTVPGKDWISILQHKQENMNTNDLWKNILDAANIN